MQPLHHAVFSEVKNGVDTIRFNPNYWEAWHSAIVYVTRTNSMESSDRTLPIQIQFISKFDYRFWKLQCFIRKRRRLLRLVSNHNSKCNVKN